MVKKFMLTIFATSFIFAIVALPALANTNYFYLEMQHRYVSGKDNGVLHNMTAGDMSISGQVYVKSSTAGAVGPYQITYEVYKYNSWLADTRIGSAYATPSTTKNVSFGNSFGQRSAGSCRPC